MRHHLVLAVASLVLVCAIACSGSAPPAPEFQTTATMKDIMESIVDPHADGLWESVEVVATLQGVVEKAPKTDDDWKALRHHAIAIMEAANLLIVPGRRIAAPGQKAEDARIDLNPEEIEALVRKDPAQWAQLARGLHDAGVLYRVAIEARDLKKFMEAGEALDTACENCHKKYWYRDDPSLYSLDPKKFPEPTPEGK
jgi:hypothetical protein